MSNRIIFLVTGVITSVVARLLVPDDIDYLLVTTVIWLQTLMRAMEIESVARRNRLTTGSLDRIQMNNRVTTIFAAHALALAGSCWLSIANDLSNTTSLAVCCLVVTLLEWRASEEDPWGRLKRKISATWHKIAAPLTDTNPVPAGA